MPDAQYDERLEAAVDFIRKTLEIVGEKNGPGLAVNATLNALCELAEELQVEADVGRALFKAARHLLPIADQVH